MGKSEICTQSRSNREIGTRIKGEASGLPDGRDWVANFSGAKPPILARPRAQPWVDLILCRRLDTGRKVKQRDCSMNGNS